MKLHHAGLVLTLLGAVTGATQAQQISPAAGVDLLIRFRPEIITTLGHSKSGWNKDLVDDKRLAFMVTGSAASGRFDAPAGYKEIHFPADPRTYVMLWWWNSSTPVYWRLVRSTASADFEVVQDSGGFYRSCSGPLTPSVWVSLVDLDGDGVPEVILQWDDAETACVFKWDGSRLALISPYSVVVKPFGNLKLTCFDSGLCSHNNRIVFDDLDGDGKAEIIAYPSLKNRRDPVTNAVTGLGAVSPTRVFKLDGGVYKLWKEIPANQPFPVIVPGIAVVHPGTIPLSEVANAKGGGDLRVFVSHPAGTAYSVDDFVATSFVFDVTGAQIAFKQRWDNHRFSDLTQGNREWMGVPVRQEARAKQGVWTVNPSDPTYPSPDPGMEFHFLGPYLELRIAKSALDPYLLQRATAEFAKDPAKTSTFIEVPISGKMKDGKLAAIGAIVCVTRTGPGK